MPRMRRSVRIGQSGLGGPDLKIGKLRFVDAGFDFAREMTVRFNDFGHVGHDGGSQAIGSDIV